MTSDFIFNAQINPLSFLEGDSQIGRDPASVTLEETMRFLCAPDLAVDVPELIARYRRITDGAKPVFVAPTEPRILQRLIWPLRHAKGSFMLGSVALCGMVSEMVAILVFDVAKTVLNGSQLEKTQQRLMFGKSFELLGQERRVDVLLGFGMIQADHKERFETIRSVRRKYLHLWSSEHASLEKDAISCFHAAAYLVVAGLGLTIKDGQIVLREEIVEYLRKHGGVQDVAAPSEGTTEPAGTGKNTPSSGSAP